MLIGFLNILVLLVLPFIFIGVINKTKAFWSGRHGAPILQPFYDFVRLLRKGQVISTTSSAIFMMAPAVTFTSVIMAGAFVPLISGRSFVDFEGGFIFFAYLLAAGKFFCLIGALDVGSSFEGMGASREAGFSSMIEPGFLIILSSIAALTGNFSFGAISIALEKAGPFGYLITFLAAIAFFIVLLAEGSRIPVDDPNTHLELTMVHEAMVLDNSGFDLGLIIYGSAMKMIIFASIVANLIIPSIINVYISAFIFIMLILLQAIIIGTIESSFARLKMSRVFEFVFIVVSLALAILALVTMRIYGGQG
ncbi:MAG: NADH-quinone oxidoreductase subunit H [Candidatus Margulisiibacteriota bacterium]